jgi:dethiobiotin synthetase
MPGGLFITGTGTGVGKTYVAALIASTLRETGKRVGVYKPVASGCEVRGGRLVSPDAIALWTAGGEPGTLDAVCPQLFSAPLAPHLAAQAEGRRVDEALLRSGIEYWRQRSDVVIVEGAGGLMSPISDEDYNADLAAEFGYPLVIVAANELGTINATLQTLITASTKKGGRTLFRPGEPRRNSRFGKRVLTPFLGDAFLHVAGIVLNSPRKCDNDPSIDSNPHELQRRCVSPLLAIVEHGGRFDRAIDWHRLCNSSVPA